MSVLSLDRAEVAQNKAQEISSQITQEMRDFFREIMMRAETTIEGLKFLQDGGENKVLEARLDRELLTQFGGHRPETREGEPAEPYIPGAEEEHLLADDKLEDLTLVDAGEEDPLFDEPTGEPAGPSQDMGALLGSLGDDSKKLKDAISALFRAGVVTRQQARDLYLTHRKAPVE